MHSIEFANVYVMHYSPLLASGICAALISAEVSATLGLPPHRSLPNRTRDVVIADYDSGMSFIAQRRSDDSSARVALLLPIPREFEIRAALAAGAAGLLCMECDVEELLLCVRRVLGGHIYVCQEAAARVAASLAHPALTTREADVLRLLAAGSCNKSIARNLNLAVGTVKAHVRAIMSKLDADTRTEAASIASQRGFLREVSAFRPRAVEANAPNDRPPAIHPSIDAFATIHRAAVEPPSVYA